MDQDRKAQQHRLRNKEKSKAAKLAWKRHHDSYMRANRKKERDNMNKTFYSIAKELEECMDTLQEAKIQKDDIFDKTCEIILDGIAGGLAFKFDATDGTISFSTILSQAGGRGQYKLQNPADTEEAYNKLYEDLKDELTYICNTVDDSIKQILAKHGFRET